MYVNYHRHSVDSNIILADSVVTNQEYADRIKELGHTVLSSCEHGFGGNHKQVQMIAEANGLRFRFVAEVYFVKDRFDREDRSNAHLVLAAKTAKGIGDLNEVISEANISGYFYRPRVDLELLYRLDPRDVFVTTACVGGIYRYGHEEAEKLILQLRNHFRDSFMIEVQYHHTDKQREANKFFLSMYRRHNIPIIMGIDSHVIYPEQESLRKLRLEANNIVYSDEEGWFLDYPDKATCIKRFQEQGVLSNAQIMEAIDNTLVFLDFEDVPLDRSRKLPPAYPNLSEEERAQLYRDLVLQGYEKWYSNVTPEQRARDMAELEYEMDTITETGTSDYFTTLYRIVEEAQKLGGVLTKTGRGSGASYATNRMLGLTSVNRLRVPVTMYPDRFISKDRLAGGSLPDLDLNISNLEAFQEAGRKVLGEWGCVPMVAFGKLGALSAWKMYARAENIPFEESNAVSDMIRGYELALKYADEDEKEDILLSDYISEEYLDKVEASKMYWGVTDSISPHPCAHLLLDRDIRREIGVIRLKNRETGEPLYAAMIDGSTADKVGYVKGDFLRVDVVKLNDEAFRTANIEQPTADEIIELTKNDAKTWEMYEKGYTVGLNQCEKTKTTARVMQFKPKNIVELSAFIAAIRPSFQSMMETFLSRVPFSYKIPALDSLLQTPEMKSSFIIYQEQIFSILMKAGISGPDAYRVIKAISKKNHEIIHSFQQKFMEGFIPYVMSDGKTGEQEAQLAAERVWQIVEDSAAYGFNASHAYCVALDSLYSAYMKANYPYEFYSSALRVYGEKNDKERLARIKNEMRQAFGIQISPPKFGQDNRDFFMDKEGGTISDALASVKYLSRPAAELLYSMRDAKYDYFVDLLWDLEYAQGIDRRQIGILIKMGYFRDFDHEGNLLYVFEEFCNGKYKITKTLKPATQEKRMEVLRALETLADTEPMTTIEKMAFETEYFGAPLTVDPQAKGMFTVIDIDITYSPKLHLYNVGSGTTGRMKMRKAEYLRNPIKEGDTIKLHLWRKKPAFAYVNGEKQKKSGQFELWIEDYDKVS